MQVYLNFKGGHHVQHSYPVLVQRRGQGRRLPPTPCKPSTLQLKPSNINFPKLNASPTHVRSRPMRSGAYKDDYDDNQFFMCISVSFVFQFYSQTHHSTPHSVHSLPHSREFIRDNKDYYYREKDRDTRREHFRDHRGPTRYIARSRKYILKHKPTTANSLIGVYYMNFG